VKLSRLTIALYVSLVFASGVVLGVFGHSLYAVASVSSKGTLPAPKSEDYRKKWLAEMQSRLKLTDEQFSKLNTISDETRARFHEVRERSKPEMDAIGHEQTEKVNSILTPAQQAEYDKMRKERDEHQKQNGGRGSGPGI
jgi:Spy/CpxP family protein refolding chaperone